MTRLTLRNARQPFPPSTLLAGGHAIPTLPSAARSPHRSRLQPSHYGASKFAMRQGSLCYAAENAAAFCLDPQILPAIRLFRAVGVLGGWRRLLARFSAGKEVIS